MVRRALLAAVAVLVPVACSSGETNPPPTSTSHADGGTSTATDAGGGGADLAMRCRALVTAFCARSVTCSASDAGTPAEQQASCEAAVEDALHCAAATAIAPSYDECLAALPNADCAKFVEGSADALPPSCRGVVQSPAPPAPTPPPTSVPPAVNKPNIILGRTSSAGAFDVYLGCLCDEVDPDSIANPVGLYGPQSRFSTASIWNRFGTFGSDFSGQSACNRFALDPPVVVNNGQIVGKLTRNQFAAGAITDPAIVSFLNTSVCVD